MDQIPSRLRIISRSGRWSGVAGGAALQAVRCCRRCGVAGGVVLQAVQHCRQLSECPVCCWAGIITNINVSSFLAEDGSWLWLGYY